ncbi:MAG TPA: hypothetical protein VMF87_08520 [Streptosporangiaceae bacterium]|nr:hypothetical protein [Streptosporangiaceae bacterium]
MAAEAACARSAVAQAARPGRVPQIWLAGTVALTLGAFTAAIALAPPASAPPVRGLTWLLFVGSSVHVASTGWLYTLPEVRGYARQRPVRLVVVPAALISAGAAAAALVSPAVLTWCLLPYYGWQFFHFQKQNLGMAALAASSQRTGPLRPAERRAIMTAGFAGIAGLLAHPGLLQLRIGPGPGWLYPGDHAVFIGAAAVFAAAVGAGLAATATRPRGPGAYKFRIVYLVSLGFFAPVFACDSPYAAVGGMTIAHGLQYLLLLGLVAAGNPRTRGRTLRLAALGNVALAGGLALSAASHLHGAGPAGRLVFGAYLGAVMAHFVIDAGMWRLRDPFPRAFLAARAPGMLSARRVSDSSVSTGVASAADRSAAELLG